jgi:hypothetical protein
MSQRGGVRTKNYFVKQQKSPVGGFRGSGKLENNTVFGYQNRK